MRSTDEIANEIVKENLPIDPATAAIGREKDLANGLRSFIDQGKEVPQFFGLYLKEKRIESGTAEAVRANSDWINNVIDDESITKIHVFHGNFDSSLKPREGKWGTVEEVHAIEESGCFQVHNRCYRNWHYSRI